MKNKENGQSIGIILAILIILLIVAFMIISLLNKPKYKVIFDTDGGSKIETVEISSQNVISKPITPSKEGYIFKGWYLNNIEYDFNNKITKDITLTAKWEEEERKKVVIKFDTLGGNLVEDIIIDYGTIIENIPNPIKEDYIFIGWYYQNKSFDFTEPIIENKILVAKWEKDYTPKFTVVFDSNGGSKIEDITVKKGGIIIEPTNPVKEGKTFAGWYLGDELYDFETPVEDNLTLQAKWN